MSVFIIDENQKLPMFDLPVDFMVYDKITGQLLSFYASLTCKIDAFILAYVVKGNVKATINLWEYDIVPDDFILLTPGSFIQIHSVSEDAQIGFAGFSSKFLKDVNFWKSMSTLLMPIFKNPILKLKPSMATIYRDALSLLTRASEIDEVTLSRRVVTDVLNLFIDSLTDLVKSGVEIQGKTSSRDRDILSEFLQLAFENYRDEHKISFYAREINLTLSHFCSVISKSTGMTPQAIIMHLIIMDAKTQLKGTDATVSHISSILGFSTPTTFNRYFKTYTGYTPQEYRNS